MTHNIIETENYLLLVSDEIDFAHLPLNNSPVLEGVPLLPPLEDEVVELAQAYVINTPDNEPLRVYAFIEGYNKAKEKYKYTEEDMVIFADWYYKTQGLPENNIKYWGKNLFEVWKSLQQPKMPVAFECEMENKIAIDGHTVIGSEPKTTTNSQGQTVLVGKYIY